MKDIKLLRDIDYQYQDQFLPEGYYYDGYCFRGQEGEISKNHPSKDNFIFWGFS